MCENDLNNVKKTTSEEEDLNNEVNNVKNSAKKFLTSYDQLPVDMKRFHKEHFQIIEIK